MPDSDRPVLLAIIGAPHGIRGEVRVKTFTGDPLAIGSYGPLSDEEGRAFVVRSVRAGKGVVIVAFEGVGTREEAEALKGRSLHVPRGALPEELDEDEFYHADLVGLAVVDEAGQAVGTVAAVHNFGAGDILELALSHGRAVMIPFSRAAVPNVDLELGQMRVDRVAAGLTPERNQEEGGP
jgi:16S rRNA processing protein RimM